MTPDGDQGIVPPTRLEVVLVYSVGRKCRIQRRIVDLVVDKARRVYGRLGCRLPGQDIATVRGWS
jgi:hypothetical protein